ncbi:MAG: DUF4394 domain-containing protein [Enhydrobacter sp.]|nr:DUF4394 domain-containing protein [Enhydrobacter sp.]
MKLKISRLGGASLVALLMGVTAAQAATLVGLTADGRLVKIDTATLVASAPMAITDSDRILGIDVRPADGKLYGLAGTGQLVTIDTTSGKATPTAMLSTKVPLGDRPVVDFNPVADRLRVIAADGANLRIDVQTGSTTLDKPLVYDTTDTNAGKKPAVAAGAYTNSTKGAKATELFHVDGGTGALVLQSPPNDGILKTRGGVGVNGPADVVLDIVQEGDGKNTVYLITGNTLHTVDLATGKATQVGMIKSMTGKLVDVAVAN